MSTLSLARTHAMESKSGWRASLQLNFIFKNHKTLPAYVKHIGPLRVQRPFYPESSAVCHSYILHPPGGVVGGDTLNLTINLEQEAHAVITTPGATKVYRNTCCSKIQNHISLAKHSVLEWMPQETILFNDSQSHMQTQLKLHAESKLFYWEIVSFGLPAIKQRFTLGQFHQDLSITIDEKVVLLEKTVIEGGSAQLTAKWGLQNRYVSGILVMKNDHNIAVENFRAALNKNARDESVVFGITEKSQFIICRVLGDNAEDLRKIFIVLWSIWRELTLNKKPVLPRIWNT